MTKARTTLLPLSEALLRYVERRTIAAADARKHLGVNELDARALRHVGDEPGIRPSRLREHLGITAAGVTTLADRLIGRGLLRREQDADDRRVNHLYLEVDLDAAPWSSLSVFDNALDRELRSRRADADGALAALLDAASDAAASATVPS